MEKKPLISPVVELAGFLSQLNGQDPKDEKLQETGYHFLLCRIAGCISRFIDEGSLDDADGGKILLMLDLCSREICLITEELIEEECPGSVRGVVRQLRESVTRLREHYLDSIGSMAEALVTADEKYIKLSESCLNKAETVLDEIREASDKIAGDLNEPAGENRVECCEKN